MNELAKKIEAILFASGKGVEESELQSLTESTPAKIKTAVQELQSYYEQQDTSLVISEYQGKWKLTVRAKYTEYIQRLVSETELAPALLKTLAVIAYKSPVLQSDIVSMRGQVSYDHVKVLVKEKFVTKEESGRSYILKITDKFYNYFDIEGDEEIREVFSQLRSQEERRAAIEEEVKKEQQQKLGGLEVVEADDSTDHEGIFDSPIRKEKTQEERKEEEEFLTDIDSRITQLAQRVESQNIPQRNAEPVEKTAEDEPEEEKKPEEDYL
jgi:segregation and condensation protein B